MSVINSDSMRAGASGVSAAGYVIENSCRFNPGDSAFMSRTPSGSGTGGGKVQTISVWLKRCNFGVTHRFLSGTATKETTIQFNDTNTLHAHTTSGADLDSRSVYRDPSAWYHVVVAYDTDNGTAGDRVRSYVNGVELTSYGTETTPSSGFVTGLFVTTTMYIGKLGWGSNYWDGYMAEFIGIDGQQLTPSSFGEFDSKGNWVPIDPTELTFGTHGFWLDFAVAPGTGNGAGTDVSGEGNHFTDSGLAANDQVSDSPTDDAANDVGNYATLNPMAHDSGVTLSDGNLQYDDANTTDNGVVRSTMAVKGGKWYFEATLTSATNAIEIGVCDETFGDGTSFSPTQEVTYRGNTGQKNVDNSFSAYGDSFTQNDVIGVALNLDAGEITFYKNNSTQGDITGVDISVSWGVHVQQHGGGTKQLKFNFGQLGFTYTPPTGFKAWNTANLPAPTITDPSKYFQVDTFTGTGSELVRTLTDGGGGAVKPDLVWIKDRDTSVEYVLTDSARGATKELNCDSENVETTVAQGVKSFDASGYTLGTDGNYNTSSSPNVAWCWNTQGGAGSSNTSGSINTTTTSVGTTQGFSISTFTGTGANATVGHGLGAVPEFIIIKNRNTAGRGFNVYHGANTAAPETDFLLLDTTAGTADDATHWNDTAPTSTVFSLGSHSHVNESGGSIVAFCWHGVEGYSKFGSYEGNGSTDGSFVWCGFRPAFVLVKNSSNAGENWYLWDAARTPANIGSASVLYPNTTAAAAEASARFPDFLSNGFKLRSTDTSVNATGRTYIFAAFAEFPFGGEDVSQARAR